MYQAVIFDLDGTLLDTIADLAAAGKAVCEASGWPVHSEEAFKAMVGNGVETLVARFSPPWAQEPEQRAETVRRFNAYYGGHCTERTRPCPGVPEALARLRASGLPMAVCSNKVDAFTRELMERFYPGVFAAVQGNRPDVPVKPDPAGPRAILRRLGADPARTLFVGDSPTDIHTGRNTGTRTCGVTWGYRTRASLIEAGAEWLADSAEELEAVIRRGGEAP